MGLTKERILTKEDWQHDRSLGQQLRTLRDVEREARKEELAKKKQREREQKEGLWLKTPNGHDREKHDREKLQQTKLARPKQPAKQDIDWECSSQSTACTARTPVESDVR